jgi:hypothetical protein
MRCGMALPRHKHSASDRVTTFSESLTTTTTTAQASSAGGVTVLRL